MARTYNLNPAAAKQSESFGGRIQTTGRYVGTFTRAEAVQSSKGTDGVEFSFKSESGESADYLTLWTYNAKGEELRGNQMLAAIMTVLRVKALNSKVMTLEKWDRDIGARAPMQCDVYPDLMNKPVGVLLQMEEYQAKDGSSKWRPVIWGVFDAATGMTPSEILEKKTKAERLAELEAKLTDKPMANAPRAQAAPQARREPAMAAGGDMTDMDDDIPF